MTDFLRDIRLSLRVLGKRPLFTTVAVATLALGIGANSTMFSILDQTLLREPPYPRPEELTVLQMTVDRPAEPRRAAPWSYAKYATLREVSQGFETLAAFDAPLDLTLTGAGQPERLRAEIASSSYFPLLGIEATAGRLFGDEEDEPTGRSPVALLSHGLFMRRFGGDSAVIGQTLTLNRKPLIVIGVLPPGFRGLSSEADLWVPLGMAGELIYSEVYQERWMHWLTVLGRRAPGVSFEQAQSATIEAGKRVDEAHQFPENDGSRWGADAVPFALARRDRALATSVTVLSGAVGFVLLIACASISSLLMARASARRQEMALRSALGAGRGRMIRQLLTESLILSLGGGALGLLFPLWGLEALAAITPARSTQADLLAGHFLELSSIQVDPRVLTFNFLLSLVVALVFGLLPAVSASRRNLLATMGRASTSARGFRGFWTARNLLVAGQVAVALVLLAGAGLMLGTFAKLAQKDLGFKPENVLTFRLQPPSEDYGEGDGANSVVTYYEQLEDRLSGIPGVEAVSFDRCTPLSGRCSGTVVTAIEGQPPIAESAMVKIGVHPVGKDYFRALGVPLLAGRTFDRTDRVGSPRVLMLNEEAARQLFPGESAVGKKMRIGMGMAANELAEVVGVVGDLHYGPPSEPVGLQAFFSVYQVRGTTTTVLVKTSQEPLALAPAFRAEVAAINRDLPVVDLSTLENRVGDSLSQARFGALLLGLFAAIAVTLAALGLYGVIATTVGERRRELGIRMALGAERGRVLALVTRHGLAVVSLGLVAGLIGARLLSRTVETLLYGVSATDPGTFAAVTALLAMVALVACWLPARRATELDPMTILKTE